MNVKNTTVKSHRALLQYGFVFYASQEQNPAKEGPSPFQAAGQHSSPLSCATHNEAAKVVGSTLGSHGCLLPAVLGADLYQSFQVCVSPACQ